MSLMQHWKTWIAAVLAILLVQCIFTGMTYAATKPRRVASPFEQPMYFVIVRSSAGYCEPNCPEWIYGEGQIVDSTPSALRKVLKQAGTRKLPLVVISPGGNVDAAVSVGRMVRDQGMDVEVGFTRFATCRPSEDHCVGDGPAAGEFRGLVVADGAFCWSACPLVLAGGMKRLSSSMSNTGVHQVTTIYQREKVSYRERIRIVNGKKTVISRKIISRKKAGTQSTTRLPKATRTMLTAYFKDMGVGRALLDAMLSTPPDRIRKLEPAEMLAMGLITQLSDDDVLASPMRCMQDAATANCIPRNPVSLSRVSAPPPPVRN